MPKEEYRVSTNERHRCCTSKRKRASFGQVVRVTICDMYLIDCVCLSLSVGACRACRARRRSVASICSTLCQMVARLLSLGLRATADASCVVRIPNANVYRFGDPNGARPVLRAVDWTVREGESWAVVGSGAGEKTALLEVSKGEPTS
jgi:hypothetical protein